MVFCNMLKGKKEEVYSCHNPYFNRWFSAIKLSIDETVNQLKVTILILIDGFLQ